MELDEKLALEAGLHFRPEHVGLKVPFRGERSEQAESKNIAPREESKASCLQQPRYKTATVEKTGWEPGHAGKAHLGTRAHCLSFPSWFLLVNSSFDDIIFLQWFLSFGSLILGDDAALPGTSTDCLKGFPSLPPGDAGKPQFEDDLLYHLPHLSTYLSITFIILILLV